MAVISQSDMNFPHYVACEEFKKVLLVVMNISREGQGSEQRIQFIT